METAPIVVDGVMYLTTSYNHVYAIDAVTGKEFWHYKHKMGPVTTLLLRPEQPRRRDRRRPLFMGTLDAKLVALDAKTGKLLWETQIADPEKGYCETMAPTVVDDKVLIGTNGGEYGVRGFVKAFDANDGKLLWTFYTIPEKGHEGVWADERCHRPQHEARHRGGEGSARRRTASFYQTLGGGVWMTPGGRPEDAHRVLRGRQSLARPVRRRAARATTSTPTRWSRSTSTTGTYKWHFQYVAHDVWDLDAVSPAILTDAKDKDGKMVARSRSTAARPATSTCMTAPPAS